MKKTLVAVFVTALLLVAVICTAGCITAPSDPFVGTWYTQISDTETGFVIVSENNSGKSVIVKNIASESGEPEFLAVANDTFSWKKNTDGTYSITYSDGTVYIDTLGPYDETFTGNDEKGTVFMRLPSELSGATPTTIIKAWEVVQKHKNT